MKFYIDQLSFFLNRVKYYCSTCYPLIDDVTESQLKRIRKCLHGEYTFLPMLLVLYSTIHVVEQTDWKQDEVTLVPRQSDNTLKNEYAIV